jgi:hypothetical protein
MSPPPADEPRDRLTVFETVQRIKMAWVALWFLLIAFAIGFGCFLYSAFSATSNTTATVISGGIDLMLAWALKIVLTHLFPAKS